MRFRALVLTSDDLEEADDIYRNGGFGSGKRGLFENPSEDDGSKEELRVWGLTLGMTL